MDLRLCVITDPRLCAETGVEETVRAAVLGGATMIQFRDKDADDAAFAALGRALVALLEGTGVPLIVNDRVEIAVAIGAGGAHIGQSDGDPVKARALLGTEAILGLSARSEAEIASGNAAPVDYLGIGPVNATSTKEGASAPLGHDGLAMRCVLSQKPVIGIGGLGAADAAGVLNAGAVGLAVVSAVCGTAEPAHAAAAIRAAIDGERA